MSEVLNVVEQLRTARLAEQASIEAAADAKAQLERAKSIALAEAFEAGQIKGSNADARKIEEAKILSGAETVRKAEAELRLAESKLAADRIARQYQEDRYHAFRALLTQPRE